MIKNKNSQPLVNMHDEIARCFLTNLDIAKQFLTLYLDPEIQSKCDLDTLIIVDGSFVKDDLTKRHSDIVYRMDLKDKSNCTYIYVLEENQSTPRKLMPFRVLEYSVLLMRKHINDYGESGGLPIVVPIIMYNGEKSPYPYETDIKNLFADRELFEKVGLGTFKLVDLTIKDDDEIFRHGKLALLETVQKHIRIRDFSKALGVIAKAFEIAHQDELSQEIFGGAWTYLSKAREADELVPLMKKIIDISDYKEFVMSYYETILEEGEMKGRQEGEIKGEIKGKIKGIQEAEHRIAQDLLKFGIDESIIIKTTHLSHEEVEELKRSV